MPNPTYNRLDDDGLLYLLTLLKTEIDAAGEDNVIETVKVNGTALTPDAQKAVNVEVPTDSDIDGRIETALANGSDPYTTTSDAQGLIDDALADITGIDFEIVAELPASGVKGVIYLVGTASPYDEYIWIEPTGGTAHFEQIGSTSIDLSGYVQASEMHALTNSEIDAIFTQVWPA